MLLKQLNHLKCKIWFKNFFEIKEIDELDDKWYPIELIIYAAEHFFHFVYCYKNL